MVVIGEPEGPTHTESVKMRSPHSNNTQLVEVDEHDTSVVDQDEEEEEEEDDDGDSDCYIEEEYEREGFHIVTTQGGSHMATQHVQIQPNSTHTNIRRHTDNHDKIDMQRSDHIDKIYKQRSDHIIEGGSTSVSQSDKRDEDRSSPVFYSHQRVVEYKDSYKNTSANIGLEKRDFMGRVREEESNVSESRGTPGYSVEIISQSPDVIELEDEPPSPEVEPESPSPEVEPESPSPEFEPESPSHEVEPESLSPEVEPESPSPEVEPESISPEVEPESISPEVEPESISPEIEPESISPEVEPESPEADLPSQEAKLQSPEAAVAEPIESMEENECEPQYSEDDMEEEDDEDECIVEEEILEDEETMWEEEEMEEEDEEKMNVHSPKVAEVDVQSPVVVEEDIVRDGDDDDDNMDREAVGQIVEVHNQTDGNGTSKLDGSDRIEEESYAQSEPVMEKENYLPVVKESEISEKHSHENHRSEGKCTEIAADDDALVISDQDAEHHHPKPFTEIASLVKENGTSQRLAEPVEGKNTTTIKESTDHSDSEQLVTSSGMDEVTNDDQQVDEGCDSSLNKGIRLEESSHEVTLNETLESGADTSSARVEEEEEADSSLSDFDATVGVSTSEVSVPEVSGLRRGRRAGAASTKESSSQSVPKRKREPSQNKNKKLKVHEKEDTADDDSEELPDLLKTSKLCKFQCLNIFCLSFKCSRHDFIRIYFIFFFVLLLFMPFLI